MAHGMVLLACLWGHRETAQYALGEAGKSHTGSVVHWSILSSQVRRRHIPADAADSILGVEVGSLVVLHEATDIVVEVDRHSIGRTLGVEGIGLGLDLSPDCSSRLPSRNLTNNQYVLM